MDYYEAKEFVSGIFLPEIANAFTDVWPDTFVKSHTLDKEKYDNANGHMYNWYVKIANNLLALPETPGIYEQKCESGYNFAYIQKMYNDFKNSDNKIIFLLTYT